MDSVAGAANNANKPPPSSHVISSEKPCQAEEYDKSVVYLLIIELAQCQNQ